VRRTVLLLVVLVLAGCGSGPSNPGLPTTAQTTTTAPSGGRWVAAYAAAMQGTYVKGSLGSAEGGALPGGRSREQTFRITAPITASGTAVRVALSNRYGHAPVHFGAVAVARRADGATTASGTSRDLRFSGRRDVTVPAGGRVVSDPAAMEVQDGEDLLVSVYVQGDGGPPTWHYTQPSTSYVAPAGSGDHTGDAGPSPFSSTSTTSVFWVDEVDVRPSARIPGAVVALGDSITDGSFLPPDEHARWTDALAARLRDRPAAERPAVVNAGIGGNRLTAPGLQFASPSAPQRFQRDVLDRAGVRTVVIAEGINDVSHGSRSAPVIAALTSLAQRARRAHLRVIGATLSPVGNSGLPSAQVPAIEAAREAVNSWVRSTKLYDGVIDIDKVLRDPANPTQLDPRLDSGDHVHPNKAGAAAIAAAVPLAALAG
jgi:lysophospholipase L1-like esterase